MASRSPSPALFFGGVVSTRISPSMDDLDRFVAFTEDRTSPSSHSASWGIILTPAGSSISPILRCTSLSPPAQSPPSFPLDPSQPPYDSTDEGPPQSLDCTIPYTSEPLADLVVSPPRCRRGTTVFVEGVPHKDVPDPTPMYRMREATVDDSEAIIDLTDALDMTNATSYVWPLEELRDRIARRDPLTIIAVDPFGLVAGCAGVDTMGMSKPLRVLSIGSRLSQCPINEEYDIPHEYCMCRGLLIHPQHQSAGLGSRLHRHRIEVLSKLYPSTKAVVLSARGSSFEEAVSTLGQLLLNHQSNTTPQLSKEDVFQFTFSTSKGVVHLAHHRENDGWRFVGVDVSDGGPVWCTSLPLPELVARYPQSRRHTLVQCDPIGAALG